MKDLGSNKNSLHLSFDVILASLCLVVPMLSYLTVLFRGLTFTIVCFVVWLMVVLVKRSSLREFGKMLSSRLYEFSLLFIFCVIILISYLFVNSSSKGFQHLFIFICFFLIYVIDAYYSVRPFQYKLTILFIIIISLGVQAAVSIPYILRADPLLIRLYSSGGLDSSQMFEAQRNGVGNNGLYTSCAPIVYIGISVRNLFSFRIRALLILSIIAIFISILLSTFLTSIALLVFIGLILLFLNFTSLGNLKVLFSILIIVTLSYLITALILSDTELLKPVLEKLDRVALVGGDVTGRDDHARTSLNTFLENPFFGIGMPEWGSFDLIGEHMPWLDYLAHFGFLGFLPFLLFILLIFYKSIDFYRKRDKLSFYRNACLMGFIAFVLTNFISPMINVPSFYVMLLMFYTCNENIYFKRHLISKSAKLPPISSI